MILFRQEQMMGTEGQLFCPLLQSRDYGGSSCILADAGKDRFPNAVVVLHFHRFLLEPPDKHRVDEDLPLFPRLFFQAGVTQ